MQKLRKRIIKITHWEYWPFDVVYLPIYVYWAWLALKARSFFFFNTANPTIENGGFLMESKKKIYDQMEEGSYPKTTLINDLHSFNVCIQKIQSNEIVFPIIAKPDIGLRGLQVKKLNNIDDLLEYHAHSKVAYLLQEYINYPNEVGIFFYKMPGDSHGSISGIVGKEFLTVIGDGQSSIEELIIQNDRYFLQLDQLRNNYGKTLLTILPKNDLLTLVPYGNHARGAKFIDLTHLADPKLNNTINSICNKIPQFYFGRMDIKYNDWNELKEGKHFSIIELNGAGSDPTHIYDPKHSIFFAWKEIIKHLNILFKISRMNKERMQLNYMTTKEGMEMLKANKAHVKLISPQ
ncbi:MAG: D-alanine--D-alanine ligase [Sphingobacteriia bacterium]|jgi:hypothetical protein